MKTFIAGASKVLFSKFLAFSQMAVLTFPTLSFAEQHTAKSEIQVSLAELTKIVSERNYLVLQEAERTYQAQVAIDHARMELLPKLNLWTLAKAAIDPISLLDAVQDIAPFLVPGNWLRLKETEILFAAEKEAYRALWGNELYSARSLYLKLLMDQGLFSIVQRHHTEITQLVQVAKARQMVGLESAETVRSLELQELKLAEDNFNLRNLLTEELQTLSLSLGYAKEVSLVLVPLQAIHPPEQNPLDYETLWPTVLGSSPELKQQDQLLKVLPLLKKEVLFNFLGASETSRGVAGGIFDHIPIPNGLGFTNGTSLKLIKSQKALLENQRTGIVEILKRQLNSAVSLVNGIIQFYPNVEKRFLLTKQNLSDLKFRQNLGDEVSLATIADAIELNSLAEASLLEYQLRYFLNQDRVNRLILSDSYSGFPKL